MLKKKCNLAFTLIEVITVMAIMSLMASIAVPKISRYIDRANKTKVIAAVSELNNFIISNEIDNKYDIKDISSLMNSYINIQDLKINIDNSGNFSSGKVKGNLKYVNGLVNAVIIEPLEFANEIIGPSLPNDI